MAGRIEQRVEIHTMKSEYFPELPIDLEIRKWKKDLAAQNDYNSALIAQAAQKWQAEHPERMAKPETYQRKSIGKEAW